MEEWARLLFRTALWNAAHEQDRELRYSSLEYP
jgi:hypothetical protein